MNLLIASTSTLYGTAYLEYLHSEMSDFFKTPKSLLEAYSNGLQGAWCDKDDLADLMGHLKHPLFSISAHNLYGTGEGKLSLPFKCLLKFDPGFGPAERQTTGDCQNGKGIFIYRSGAVYIGDFKNGEIHGVGVCSYSDGSKYQGEWVHRYPEGRGTKTFPDGAKYRIEIAGVEGINPTATGATKPATLITGHVVNVPLFIEQGERLKIDTRTGEYVERAKD